MSDKALESGPSASKPARPLFGGRKDKRRLELKVMDASRQATELLHAPRSLGKHTDASHIRMISLNGLNLRVESKQPAKKRTVWDVEANLRHYSWSHVKTVRRRTPYGAVRNNRSGKTKHASCCKKSQQIRTVLQEQTSKYASDCTQKQEAAAS